MTPTTRQRTAVGALAVALVGAMLWARILRETEFASGNQDLGSAAVVIESNKHWNLRTKAAVVDDDLSELKQSLADLDWIPLKRLIDSYDTAVKQSPIHDTALLNKLEAALFDWKKPGVPPFYKWRGSWKGRGIVLSAGDRQVPSLVSLLKGLRQAVRCQLPIEIVYMDKNDLSPEFQSAIESLGLPDVRFVDASTNIDIDKLLMDNGWSKVVALLVSSFEEVLFLDSDTTPLFDPAELFNDERYIAKRSLFFHELNSFVRHKNQISRLPEGFAHSTLLWLQSFMPLSREAMRVNMLRASIRKEQVAFNYDSSLFLFHKSRLTYLLTMLKLGEPVLRSELYYRFYGDADIWWVASEMAGNGFPGTYPFRKGIVGAPLDEDSPSASKAALMSLLYSDAPKEGPSVCGFSANHDENGEITFWNGGVFLNKQKIELGIANITRWLPMPAQHQLSGSMVSKTSSSATSWEGATCFVGQAQPLSAKSRAKVDSWVNIGWDTLDVLTRWQRKGVVGKVSGKRRRPDPYKLDDSVARNDRAIRAMDLRRAREADLPV